VQVLEVRTLLSAGSLDPTFGTGGQTFIAFGQATGSTNATAVALQPDGKIVVAGAIETAGGDSDFAAARLNPNGALDSSFGNAGRVVIPFNLGGDNRSGADALALQPDGKIVLAGTADTAAGPDFAAVRLNPDGSLDGSFGGGQVAFALNGSTSSLAAAVALQPDGRIVLAGSAGTANGSDFAAARLQPNGSLDGTFGSGGEVLVPFDPGSSAAASGCALQPDGKIVLSGTSQSEFVAARLDPGGTLDGGFGNGGKVVVNPGEAAVELAEDTLAAALQPDGKIVLAGSLTQPPVTVLQFRTHGVVYRLNADGSRDSSFGGGEVSVPLLPDAVALQPAGKILLAGSDAGSGTFAAARLNANGALDLGFGSGGKVAVAAGVAQALALQPDGKIVLAGSGFVVVRLTAHTPPVVTGVQVLRSGRRGTVQGLVLSFGEALDPASAQNLAHYALLVPRKGKKHRPRVVPIRAASYNPANHTVTLTLGKLKSTDRSGMLQVTGVTDLNGDPLAATVFAVDLRPRRKH
jgi:uncharacterized delta-60 repeat protein